MSNEWEVPVDESEDKPKMVIVMRKDLKVPKGKAVAQGAHAAVGAVIQALYGFRLEENDFRLDAYAYKVRKDAYVDSATKDWLAGEWNCRKRYSSISWQENLQRLQLQ